MVNGESRVKQHPARYLRFTIYDLPFTG